MRVAADHLGVDVGAHVVDGELAGILRDLALQHDLEEDVAQLLAQMGDGADTIRRGGAGTVGRGDARVFGRRAGAGIGGGLDGILRRRERLDGVNCLVGLLDHVVRDAAMRLLAVPRTTVGSPKRRDRRDERLEVRVRFGIGDALRRRGGNLLGASRVAFDRIRHDPPPYRWCRWCCLCR